MEYSNKKKSQYNKFNKIIDNNIDEVRNFLLNNIPDSKYRSKYKIDINCIYCDNNRHRHKMVINIDWYSVYCYRCGKTLSLYRFLKELNLLTDFFDLISSLSNISLYDLKTVLKTNNADIDAETKEENIDDDNKIVKDFIIKNGLYSIDKMMLAKKYALSRTYNNEDEIKSYLADDKYIYIPIVVNGIVIAYMGRLYIGSDNTSLPRYNMKMLREDIPLIGFYDEVSENFSTNTIYLTEGYLDSYAINYAMSNYVSICMFGKGKIKNIIDTLANTFSSNTKIYLTLDSKKKDREIVKSNIMIGNILIEYFPNTYIVELTNEDPNSLLNNYGPMELKEDLNRKVTPFFKYKIFNK